jgi:hypothetical protein
VKPLSFSLRILGALFAFSQAVIAWQPGIGSWDPATERPPSTGFTVDTYNRNDVLSFWHAIYQGSEGYEDRVGLTPDFTNLGAGSIEGPPGTHVPGAEGQTSAEFVKDVQRRVNYYRAMTGLPASVAMNTTSTIRVDSTNKHYVPGDSPEIVEANRPTKAEAAQRSAFMMLRTFTGVSALGTYDGLDHDPVASKTVGYTRAAWNGNFHSNLSFGLYGPGAIDGYASEVYAGLEGANNQVGHRRLLLNPVATNFATGDMPSSPPFTSGTNALYVIQKAAEEATGVPDQFVSYPNEGYFPAPLNTHYWSLSHPKANFANASVTVTSASGSIPVVVQPIGLNQASPTLVWQVPSPVSSQSIDEDVTYTVTVTGIAGIAGVTTYTYPVTLINPDRLDSPQELTGLVTPHITTPVSYSFEPVPQAENYEVEVYRYDDVNSTETAEDANQTTSKIVAQTTGTYEVRSNAYFNHSTTYFTPIDGAKSYRLTFPTNLVEDQILLIQRNLIPNPLLAPKLTFKYKWGFTTASTYFVVEGSEDDGQNWTALSAPIQGLFEGFQPNVTRSVSIDLSGKSGPLQIRFRFYYDWASNVGLYDIVNQPTYPSGVFIDTISITGCTEPLLQKTYQASGSASSIQINNPAIPLTSGTKWSLRMRTQLGGNWFAYGPYLDLYPTTTLLTGSDGWATYNIPGTTQGFSGDDDGDGIANAIEYAFSYDPLAPNSSVADGIGTAVNPSNTAQRILSIQRPLPEEKSGITYGATWSDNLTTWNSATVVIDNENKVITATAPPSNKLRFIRWNITQP